MSCDGAIIFGDLIGKPGVLRGDGAQVGDSLCQSWDSVRTVVHLYAVVWHVYAIVWHAATLIRDHTESQVCGIGPCPVARRSWLMPASILFRGQGVELRVPCSP